MGHGQKCPDDVFLQLFETKGPQHISRQFGVNIRNVYSRRKGMEARIGRQITAPVENNGPKTRFGISHPHRIEVSIPNGVVLIGSDAHIWPGPPTTAMRAFIHLAKELKPRAIILNGDVMDFPTISRHPPIGWEKRPSVQDEIEAAQEQLHEIERATPKGCERIWTLGNHDARFETRIATLSPELAKVAGVHLKDHFPLWQGCWSAWINGGVVVKHRFKNGIHATHNSTVNSGKTIITGHLHSLKVTPFSDYNGTRWGVDSGCLADAYGKQFIDYTEDNSRSWRSGFVVLTFVHGKLLWPEIVSVFDENKVDFRGSLIRI